MKSIRFLSLVITFVMSTCMYALEVGHLKTQAYTNPIGIDLTTPSFSWVSERNVMQTSYSIKVSTERDFSNVVWESGTVESDQSADVLATGFTPQARTATLYMPVADGYELKESGQPVSECSDIEYLGIEDGKAVCRLGSGSYRFTVDNATGINNVQGFNSSKVQEDIYNLQGYKIPNSQLSTLNPQLSNGVYIQGGRKMIK